MIKSCFQKLLLVCLLLHIVVFRLVGQFTVDALLGQGVEHFNNKNYSTAAAFFDQVISQNDTIQSAWYNRGLCKLNLKDYVGAEQDFTTLLLMDPTSIKALKFLSYVDMKLHKIDVAIHYLNKVVELNPLDGESLLNRGILKNLKKTYKEALKDFDACIAINPELHTIYYNSGLSNMSLKNFKQAIQDFTMAIEKKPDYMGYLLNRANAYLNYEEYDLAIRDLDQYLDKDPANDYAKRSRSIAQLKQNIKRKGVQVLDSLSYDNPKNIQIVRDRSIHKIKNKDYTGGLIDIRTVEKMYPTDIELKYSKGLALYNIEKYDRALTEFDKVLDHDPKHGWAHYYKAMTKKSLNHYKTKNICHDLLKASDLGVIEAAFIADKECKRYRGCKLNCVKVQ